MARENSGLAYDRIVDALSKLGYTISDQTVGNVLMASGRAETQPNITSKEFIVWPCWLGSTSSQ
jgi:hypothetical protein